MNWLEQVKFGQMIEKGVTIRWQSELMVEGGGTQSGKGVRERETERGNKLALFRATAGSLGWYREFMSGWVRMEGNNRGWLANTCGIIKSSRATSRVWWLSEEKANVSRTISVFVFRLHVACLIYMYITRQRSIVTHLTLADTQYKFLTEGKMFWDFYGFQGTSKLLKRKLEKCL
jgi:hypothetical protein